MSHYILSGDRKISYPELNERGARAASGLAALGIGENDSVAIMLRNDIAYLEATVATTFLGAYAVPVNWHFTDKEAKYLLDDCDAKAVLVHADILAGLDDWLPPGVKVLVVETPPEIAAAYGIAPELCRVPGDQVNWDHWLQGFDASQAEASDNRSSMIYTSGTTGLPKGVRRQPASEEQQASGSKTARDGFGLKPGMIAAMTGPLYHSAPNGFMRGTLKVEGTLVLLPKFEPEGLLAAIEKFGISHMHAVPTMFVRLLRLPEAVKTKYDLSSLKFICYGAAPCPIEVRSRMLDWWGPVLYEYYGSTEAGLITLGRPEDFALKPGTVGRPHAGREVRIYDDDGAILPAGEIGEIYMNINTISDFTYYKNQAERDQIGRADFVTNGDVGYLDADGYLFLCDRKRDMVISGGVNIYPAEIEGVLINCPGVADCAVFGIPDEDFGEALAAAVEPLPDHKLDVAAIQSYLRQHLANFKVPKIIEQHSSLPREDTGKIFKRKLRDPYWEKAGRRI